MGVPYLPKLPPAFHIYHSNEPNQTFITHTEEDGSSSTLVLSLSQLCALLVRHQEPAAPLRIARPNHLLASIKYSLANMPWRLCVGTLYWTKSNTSCGFFSICLWSLLKAGTVV